MVGLEPVHLALQHDAPAGCGLPVRILARRAADRPADRRAALSRRPRAARLARLRDGTAVQDAAWLTTAQPRVVSFPGVRLPLSAAGSNIRCIRNRHAGFPAPAERPTYREETPNARKLSVHVRGMPNGGDDRFRCR